MGLGNLPRVSRRAGEIAAHGRCGNACAARFGAGLRARRARAPRCGPDRKGHRGNGAHRRGRRACRRARILDVAHRAASRYRWRSGARHHRHRRGTRRHRPRDGPCGPRRVRNGERHDARMGRIRLDGQDEPRNRPTRHFCCAAVDRQGTAARRTNRQHARRKRQWRQYRRADCLARQRHRHGLAGNGTPFPAEAELEGNRGPAMGRAEGEGL